MTLQFIALQPNRTTDVLAPALWAAGRVLGDLGGREIGLAVSGIDQSPLGKKIAAQDQDASLPIVGVSQGFAGPLAGQALLLFAEPTGLALVRKLLNQDTTPQFMTEMDSAALTEIANVIINLCVEALGASVGAEIGTAAPVPQRGILSTLLRPFDDADESAVVTLRLRISTGQQEFAAELLFVIGQPLLDRFWNAAVTRRPNAVSLDG
jgi:chemotaxis protein CheY-P-specific phosphatase CheC